MGSLETLQAQVEQTIGIEQSAIALIQGLALQIEELKGQPEALQALADRLRTSADGLAAAVSANQPQPPPA